MHKTSVRYFLLFIFLIRGRVVVSTNNWETTEMKIQKKEIFVFVSICIYISLPYKISFYTNILCITNIRREKRGVKNEKFWSHTVSVIKCIFF